MFVELYVLTHGYIGLIINKTLAEKLYLYSTIPKVCQKEYTKILFDDLLNENVSKIVTQQNKANVNK